MSSRVRRVLAAAAIAFAAVLLASIAARIGVLRTLDWKIYDQHVRRAADPSSARRDIVVVSIDETSIRKLEPVVGRWPWPRLVYASVIDYLHRAPARVVACDLLFTERDRRSGFDVGGETWDGAASDRAFAESVAASGNVVMLVDATYEGLVDEGGAAGADTSPSRQPSGGRRDSAGAVPPSSGGRPDSAGVVTPSPGGRPDSAGAVAPSSGGRLGSAGAVSTSSGGRLDSAGAVTPSPGGRPDSAGAVAPSSGGRLDSAGAVSTSSGGRPALAGPTASQAALPLSLDDAFEERPQILLPYPELARAARAFGHNYLVLDPDGPVRRVVPFVRHEGRFVPSLAVAAYLVAHEVPTERIVLQGGELRIGDRHVPLVRDRLPRFAGETRPSSVPDYAERLLVSFRGAAVLDDGRTTTYKEFSFYDLFYSEQQLLAGEQPFIDPERFRNAIVFVGITAAGLHDVFTVPFGETGGKMPGSHLYANVVDQLMAGRFVQPASTWTIRLLAVLGALAGAFALVLLPVRVGALVSVAATVAIGAGAAWAFGRGIFVPVVSPVLALVVGSVGGLGYQYFVEGREKRAVKRLFSRYLSRDVYEQVLANPALAELGGTRREMSVLFSDIRGFTALTEGGDPEQLVAQLNEYFSRMVDIVFAHRGTLDKFVGDMVMALFGAPLDDPDHADHAVQAALDMVNELARLNARWQAQGRATLGIGIGVNSGEMIAGNIGAEKIRSYTVIGDHVNLGARLESLNKEHGTSIIISGHTKRRLRGAYDFRSLGEVVVKGKSVAVDIYEVRGRG